MVIISTSTEDVSIQAVSPVSILGGAGVAAGAAAAGAAAAGAGVAAGAAAVVLVAAAVVLVAVWASAEAAIAPPASVATSAKAASRLSLKKVIRFPLVPMA